MARFPTPAVRGRDSELAVIGDHCARLRDGAGAVVVIEGPAGMGKSRLLDEAARLARRLSVRVGTGGAEPGDGVVEMAPLMAALFDGEAPLMDRSAVPDFHALPEQRYWLLGELETLLEQEALAAPLLVCLDDLQWADSGTAAALRALPSRLAALPIAWVVAFRPGQASPQLLSAIDHLEEQGAVRLVLGPLGDAAVARVTADVMRAEADDALLVMAERAHGSPFVLVELLSGLLEEELVRVQDGRAGLVETRLPLRVRTGMRGRLDRMSAPARQAATVAAVLGRHFSFDDLATMLGLAPSALLTPVDDLIRADLLIEDGDKLAFGHDITREAVLDSLPVSARRALGRQAAGVLLAAGAMPVEVATLLVASAEPGDEVAITALLKAAQALGSSDPDAAADLGQKALALAPPEHPLRGPLVAETAVLLHAAGRAGEAKAFADTALGATFPPEQEAEVRLSIAGMFAISPDVRAEAGRQALALDGLPELTRARHLARLVHNLLVAGRPDEAREMLAETKRAVHASGDAEAAFTLELAEAGLDYVAGRFAASLAQVESAVRHGADANDHARHLFAREWRGEWLAALDRLDESLEASAEDLRSAQRDRQGWAVRLLEAWRGRQLLQLGRLSDAAAVLEDRFDPGDAHAVVAVQDVAGLVALGRVAIHTGDRRQHRRAAEMAAVVIEGNTPAVRRHAAWLLALLKMAEGDPSAALAHLRVFGEAERLSVLPLFPMDVTDDVQLVRIALAAGDPELASRSIAAAAERARRNPGVRSLAGTAAHARGLLDDDADALAEAVELFADTPRPLTLASALEDQGRMLAGSGRNEQAVEALGRALELYARAEASWDAGRVRGRLRALGVRRRLVATERPQRGWAAMTESELAVVRLVADGMTNREAAERLYVSSHTVSTHLRHAFAKLGINSRVELTRLAIAHERDG